MYTSWWHCTFVCTYKCEQFTCVPTMCYQPGATAFKSNSKWSNVIL